MKLDDLKEIRLNDYSLSLEELNYQECVLFDDLYLTFNYTQEDIYSTTHQVLNNVGKGFSTTINILNDNLEKIKSKINNILIKVSGNLNLIEKEIDKNLVNLNITKSQKSLSITVNGFINDNLLYNNLPNNFNVGINEYKKILTASNNHSLLEWLGEHKLKKITDEVNNNLKLYGKNGQTIISTVIKMQQNKLINADKQLKEFKQYSVYDLDIENFTLSKDIGFSLISKTLYLGNRRIHINVKTIDNIIKDVSTIFYQINNQTNKTNQFTLKTLSVIEIKKLYHDIKELLNLMPNLYKRLDNMDGVIHTNENIAISIIENTNKLSISNYKSHENGLLAHFTTMFIMNTIQYYYPQLQLLEQLSKSINALYLFSEKCINNLK